MAGYGGTYGGQGDVPMHPALAPLPPTQFNAPQPASTGLSGVDMPGGWDAPADQPLIVHAIPQSRLELQEKVAQSQRDAQLRKLQAENEALLSAQVNSRVARLPPLPTDVAGIRQYQLEQTLIRERAQYSQQLDALEAKLAAVKEEAVAKVLRGGTDADADLLLRARLAELEAAQAHAHKAVAMMRHERNQAVQQQQLWHAHAGRMQYAAKIEPDAAAAASPAPSDAHLAAENRMLRRKLQRARWAYQQKDFAQAKEREARVFARAAYPERELDVVRIQNENHIRNLKVLAKDNLRYRRQLKLMKRGLRETEKELYNQVQAAQAQGGANPEALLREQEQHLRAAYGRELAVAKHQQAALEHELARAKAHPIVQRVPVPVPVPAPPPPPQQPVMPPPPQQPMMPLPPPQQPVIPVHTGERVVGVRYIPVPPGYHAAPNGSIVPNQGAPFAHAHHHALPQHM